jgi:ComF family protein
LLLQKTIFKDLFHLFYPHVCTGCGSDIIQDDNLLCLHCISQLPYTNFEKHVNNLIEKIFIGRLSLVNAMSEFYFAKGALIQTLIHELKYKGNKEMGLYLGKLMARSLTESNRFNGIDTLIPLPLFAEKEFKRGYNQATILCNGISEVMNIPVLTTAVARKKFTETQTKKHRTERWENVEESFAVINPAQLKNKHVLLVDDVITTGATLEACGAAILKNGDVSLSIATLAYAAK